MVGKKWLGLVKSLHQKKYRKQHGLFVAEGKKVIKELLDAELEVHSLYTVDPDAFNISSKMVYEITDQELQQISFLTTPQVALAVFYIPKMNEINLDGLTLVLDDVRDPGNLGTIIRLCDWFGVKELVCSKQTVDCFNPKVVQATMGSITRVNINYLDIKDFLLVNKATTSVFGTFMDGTNIYRQKLPQKAIVIMGNEANGISEEIKEVVDYKITIPQFGSSQKTESLNVATATAVVLSEFRRS